VSLAAAIAASHSGAGTRRTCHPNDGATRSRTASKYARWARPPPSVRKVGRRLGSPVAVGDRAPAADERSILGDVEGELAVPRVELERRQTVAREVLNFVDLDDQVRRGENEVGARARAGALASQQPLVAAESSVDRAHDGVRLRHDTREHRIQVPAVCEPRTVAPRSSSIPASRASANTPLSVAPMVARPPCQLFRQPGASPYRLVGSPVRRSGRR
jgi:hypothetical protein